MVMIIHGARKANIHKRDQPYGHYDPRCYKSLHLYNRPTLWSWLSTALQKLTFIKETNLMVMMMGVTTKAYIHTRDQPYGHDDRRYNKRLHSVIHTIDQLYGHDDPRPYKS